MKNPQWINLLLWMVLILTNGACRVEPTVLPIQAEPTASPARTVAVPSPTAEPSSALVPEGLTPTIDGTLDPGEWDQAMKQEFPDGSELFFMHKDGILYLAIHASTPEMIAANVFMERDGEIRIMHASAALGTGVYQQRAGEWMLIQAFQWRCRRTDSGPEAIAEREQFRLEEHWLAANSRMGAPNQLEYQIECPNELLHIAVSFMRSSASEERIFWPRALNDASTQVFSGGLPAQLEFLPGDWGSLRLYRVE